MPFRDCGGSHRPPFRNCGRAFDSADAARTAEALANRPDLATRCFGCRAEKKKNAVNHSHVWNAGVGRNEEERKRDTTFFSFTVVAQTCCQSVQSHSGPVRVHGASHGSRSLRFVQKTFTLHRAMSYITPHLMTPRTGTPSSLILNPSLSEHKPCGDLRPQLSGAVAELRPFTGCEPNRIVEDPGVQALHRRRSVH